MVMEKKLTISLDEIKTVRFVCKRAQCGGVIELPIGRLKDIPGEPPHTIIPACPSCGQTFPVEGLRNMSGFQALWASIQNLIGNPGYSVEFVLPAPNGD